MNVNTDINLDLDTKATVVKERELRVSEVFYSIEGEGPFSGMPTVFVRMFGCNFTCSGFNNPDRAVVEVVKLKELKKFKPTVGCDSIYSWHPSYKDITKKYTISELAQEILNTLPNKAILNPKAGTKPILSLTGGEPTMHQKAIVELLNNPLACDFEKILIETNCAVTLTSVFIQALNDWANQHPDRLIIWGCSPKLSLSGEPRAKAIRPEILKYQRDVTKSFSYLKFVSDGSDESFEEIEATIVEYNAYLNSYNAPIGPYSVYVMPEGATTQQQDMVQSKVALKCMEYGFSFCARVHCYVFGNEIGT